MPISTPIYEDPALLSHATQQYREMNAVGSESKVEALRGVGVPVVRGLFNTAHYNREQYLQLRKCGIGASDVSVLMGVNPWKKVEELFEERVTGISRFQGNARTDWGTAAEDFVAQVFGHETSQRVVRPKAMHSLRVGDNRYINATLDFITADQSNTAAILECKAPANDTHWGEIPIYYWMQIQQQMMVSGIHRAHLAAFIYPGYQIAEMLKGSGTLQKYFDDPVFRESVYLGGQFKYFPVVPDYEVMSEIVRRSLAFLDMVESEKLDPTVFSPYEVRTAGQVSGPEPVTVVADEDVILNIQQAAEAKKQMDAYEKTYKDLREGLLKGILSAGQTVIVTHDGQPMLTKKTVTQRRFDAKILQKEHPDIDIDKYKVPSVSENVTFSPSAFARQEGGIS